MSLSMTLFPAVGPPAFLHPRILLSWVEEGAHRSEREGQQGATHGKRQEKEGTPRMTDEEQTEGTCSTVLWAQGGSVAGEKQVGLRPSNRSVLRGY